MVKIFFNQFGQKDVTMTFAAKMLTRVVKNLHAYILLRLFLKDTFLI